MDCGEEKESFMLVWRNHQLLFGFLTIGLLPRVSRLSAKDKGDNEMIPWRSPIAAMDLHV